MELILVVPELEGSALKEIVRNISEVKYLNHIIIGLDKAILINTNMHILSSKLTAILTFME